MRQQGDPSFIATKAERFFQCGDWVCLWGAFVAQEHGRVRI